MININVLPELYIDMDETIYNASEMVIKHYNLDYNEDFDWRANTKYSWGDTKAPVEYFIEVLDREGIFINGKPLGNSVEIFNKLHNEGYKIYFISLPRWNKHCAFEKVSWLKFQLPWIDLDKDVIFTGNKQLLDGKNRIIYDDNPKYLTWVKGINIAYDQPWNRDMQPYIGYRAKTHTEFYNIVHRITENLNKAKEF